MSEEVRVTSASGGQKGKKQCQPSLIPPTLRARWVALWAKEGADRRILKAARAMIRFECGASVATLFTARDALASMMADRYGGHGSVRVMGDIYGFGAQKYSRTNYLRGFEWSLTQDAFWRHLILSLGTDLDTESGKPHIGHALWHVKTQIIYAQRELGVDDRLWKKGGDGYCLGVIA